MDVLVTGLPGRKEERALENARISARLCGIIGLCLLAGGIHPSLSQSAGNSVRISTYNQSQELGSDGIPKGWRLKVWQGRPDLKLVNGLGSGDKAIRMRSEKASVALYRDLKIDLKTYPTLSWQWKVTKLPQGADARINNKDDQAAGVYAIFPRFPSLFNSRLIGYVWDSSVPAGTVLQSRKSPQICYIVIQSGRGKMNAWINEERDVYADYQMVFGEDPPKVGALSLTIDTDDTRSKAESFFGRIAFTNKHAKAPSPESNKFAKIID